MTAYLIFARAGDVIGGFWARMYDNSCPIVKMHGRDRSPYMTARKEIIFYSLKAYVLHGAYMLV